MTAANPLQSIVPSYLRWSYGGKILASPLEAQSSDFSFWFSSSLARGNFSFREEIRNAALALNARGNDKPIALGASGGIYSEALALTFKELGIPFELFFLDIWELNHSMLKQFVLPLAEKTGASLHVVPLDRLNFARTFKSRFHELGAEYPQTLALTHLIDSIPENYFPVFGLGHFERAGPLFEKIGTELPLESEKPEEVIPFVASSISFYLYGAKYRPQGEYYFFQSSPTLVASMLTDPDFQCSYPFASTRKIIHREFPEIEKRDRSSNWDSERGIKENREIRKSLAKHAENSEALRFWRRAAASKVERAGIFLES